MESRSTTNSEFLVNSEKEHDIEHDIGNELYVNNKRNYILRFGANVLFCILTGCRLHNIVNATHAFVLTSAPKSAISVISIMQK